MALTKEWADKYEIADELKLGPRRVLGLAIEHGWRAKPGVRQKGIKQPRRLFSTADVLAYQASRNPAINPDGTLVPRHAVPPRLNSNHGLLNVLLANLVERVMGVEKKQDLLLEAIVPGKARPQLEAAKPQRDTNGIPYSIVRSDLPAFCYIPLKDAARHIGVARKVIKQACDSGKLYFTPDDRGRPRVRLRDVEEFDFGSLVSAARAKKPARTKPAKGRST